MINQIFVPTVARFVQDLKISWGIQRPLVDAGYNPGLMLVLHKGIQGLRDTGKQQIENLRPYAKEYGDAPVVVMLSNFPIEDIDFLHDPVGAGMYLTEGIDFAARLPVGGKRRIVTFHLNSLVTKEEFIKTSSTCWRGKFSEEALPKLEILAKYAETQGVELKVELVPTPEFGDIPDTDERTHLGKKLREFFNPWYMTVLGWGARELRGAGIGVCLDVCHVRTIYLAAQVLGWRGVLFPSDELKFSTSGLRHSLMDDVLALSLTDIVHLNDGDGYFDRDGGVFREGVALGYGDIKEMPRIVRHLDKKGIPYVLEINEPSGDFENRPELRKSIRYLIELSK